MFPTKVGHFVNEMSAVDHTVVSVQVMEVVDPTLEKHPDVGYLEEKIVAAYEKGCNDLTEVEAVGPKLKLFYSQKRKGDVVRLACIHGNVALEESYMYEDDFQTLTAHMIQPYGHALVLLSLDDQLVLTQAAAIMRYVGKLTGLYPTSDDLYAAKIDMILEGEVELFAGLSVVRHKGMPAAAAVIYCWNSFLLNYVPPLCTMQIILGLTS